MLNSPTEARLCYFFDQAIAGQARLQNLRTKLAMDQSFSPLAGFCAIANFDSKSFGEAELKHFIPKIGSSAKFLCDSMDQLAVGLISIQQFGRAVLPWSNAEATRKAIERETTQLSQEAKVLLQDYFLGFVSEREKIFEKGKYEQFGAGFQASDAWKALDPRGKGLIGGEDFKEFMGRYGRKLNELEQLSLLRALGTKSLQITALQFKMNFSPTSAQTCRISSCNTPAGVIKNSTVLGSKKERIKHEIVEFHLFWQQKEVVQQRRAAEISDNKNRLFVKELAHQQKEQENRKRFEDLMAVNKGEEQAARERELNLRRKTLLLSCGKHAMRKVRNEPTY